MYVILEISICSGALYFRRRNVTLQVMHRLFFQKMCSNKLHKVKLCLDLSIAFLKVFQLFDRVITLTDILMKCSKCSTLLEVMENIHDTVIN